MELNEDTIVARATALGSAGVAIVRLSGKDAVAIASLFLRIAGDKGLHDIPPRYMATASIIMSGDVLDHCLVVRFAAPRSFTGEDVVELHLHGNPLIVEHVVNLATRGGARLATAGEFTRRSFLHGKLDLTQVEALSDLLAAESEQTILIAQRQFAGELRGRLLGFREHVLNLLAMLELELDFVEEGYHFTSIDTLNGLLDDLSDFVDDLLTSYQVGNRLRRGPRVLLLGKPNAGKSSLFNSFVGYSRSLVSPVAGTTRDYIEEVVSHNGVAFHFIDTAGLRETSDDIEEQGVVLANALIPLSDHICYLIDPVSNDYIEREVEAMYALSAEFPDSQFIPVLTKQDKDTAASLSGCMTISIYDRHSLQALLDRLVAGYTNSLADAISLVSQRQYHILVTLKQTLADIRSSVFQGTEFLSADLRTLLVPLSELTGDTTNEDVLNHLFTSFCIGK